MKENYFQRIRQIAPSS